jgi:hypothetical protein
MHASSEIQTHDPNISVAKSGGHCNRPIDTVS